MNQLRTEPINQAIATGSGNELTRTLQSLRQVTGIKCKLNLKRLNLASPWIWIDDRLGPLAALEKHGDRWTLSPNEERTWEGAGRIWTSTNPLCFWSRHDFAALSHLIEKAIAMPVHYDWAENAPEIILFL